MTYVGTARLECDGLDDFPLDLANGFPVDSLDLGFPAIRSVVDPNVDRDGENDRTRLFGGRAVTLSGTVLPTASASRQAVLDRLSAFMAPFRRPWLVYELEPGSGERRIRLRPDQMTRPIVKPGAARVTVGWRAPDGYQESADEIVVEGSPAGDQHRGRSYDRSYDLDYPSLVPIGDVVVDNIGTLPSFPKLRITGPINGFLSVRNLTTGRRLVIPFMILYYVGDVVDFDNGAKTVTHTVVGESEDLSGRIILPESSWWSLAPGVNVIRYSTSRFYEQGAALTVTYRPAWI